MKLIGKNFRVFFKEKSICRFILYSFFLFFVSQGWAVDYNQFIKNKIKEREGTASQTQEENNRKVDNSNQRQQRNPSPSSSPSPTPSHSPSSSSNNNPQAEASDNNPQTEASDDNLDQIRKYQKVIKNYNSVLKDAMDSPEGSKKAMEIINNSSDNLQKNIDTQNPAATRTPDSINEGNSLPGATSPELKIQELLQRSQVRDNSNQNIFKSSWDYLIGSSNDENMPKPSAMLSQVLVIFQDMPDERLRNMFTGKLEGTFLEKWSNKFPKVLEFFILLLKDQAVLPSMAQMMDDRRKLIIFFICNIVVFVVGFIWKRANRNAEKTYFERAIIDRIKYSFVFWGVRIGLVVFFFHQELTPFGRLFKDHFLS